LPASCQQAIQACLATFTTSAIKEIDAFGQIHHCFFFLKPILRDCISKLKVGSRKNWLKFDAGPLTKLKDAQQFSLAQKFLLE
jgi:hypothetical protein